MTKRKEQKVEVPDQQMGIDVGQIITANDGSDITKDQVMHFIDAYLELVESFGWSSGGGFTLLDVNEDNHVFSGRRWVTKDHVERLGKGEDIPIILWADRAQPDDIHVYVHAERVTRSTQQ